MVILLPSSFILIGNMYIFVFAGNIHYVANMIYSRIGDISIDQAVNNKLWGII